MQVNNPPTPDVTPTLLCTLPEWHLMMSATLDDRHRQQMHSVKSRNDTIIAQRFSIKPGIRPSSTGRSTSSRAIPNHHFMFNAAQQNEVKSRPLSEPGVV